MRIRLFIFQPKVLLIHKIIRISNTGGIMRAMGFLTPIGQAMKLRATSMVFMVITK